MECLEESCLSRPVGGHPPQGTLHIMGLSEVARAEKQPQIPLLLLLLLLLLLPFLFFLLLPLLPLLLLFCFLLLLLLVTHIPLGLLHQ